MQRIFATRNDKTVALFIDGEQKHLECFDVNEAKEIMQLIKAAKEGDASAMDIVNLKMDPNFKTDHPDCPYLEVNRHKDIFFKGINVPMESILADKFIEYYQDGLPIEHLKNFWSLCLQNPDKRARKDLFKFLKTFNFIITDYGYFIGYKSVYFRGEKNRALLEFLSKHFIDSKISRADLSKDFIYFNQETKEALVLVSDLEDPAKIFNDMLEQKVEEFKASSEDNDEELFQEYTEEIASEFSGYKFICRGRDIQDTISDMLENDEADTFTDCHTQTMDIRLGTPVSMPREECDDDPSVTCSSGLHIGAPGYVKGFGNSHSKSIIACLVNPADVVAVPYDYNYMKMRTSKYYPYAICEINSDGSVKEIEAKFFEEDFRDYEIKALEEILVNGELKLPDMTKEEAMELIKNRLLTIN